MNRFAYRWFGTVTEEQHMTRPTEHPNWQRSSACTAGNCIEVAKVAGRVLIRDAKNPDAAPLSFTEGEWAAFVQGISNGDFRLE
jgi:hypothetical protein